MKLSFIILCLSVVWLMACEDSVESYELNPENIAGIIRNEVNLSSGQSYLLDGALIVENGGRLNIEPGVMVVAKGGTDSYIAIAQGGQIFAQGTEEAPIVLTSDQKYPGAWGGLVICGRAPTNLSSTGSGVVKAEVTGLPYGGSDDEDNSGILSFVRVEYSGLSYDDEHQFNGFSFFGVGSATSIRNISSYCSADDGIEFFGGYLNADYVVAINSGDDGLDFTDGWQGQGRFWYAYNSTKSGIEGSNNENGENIGPTTSAYLSDITVYKMGEYPWFLKDGSGSQHVDNLVIGGLTDNVGHDYFYYIVPIGNTGDMETHKRILSGEISFTNVRFINLGIGNESKTSGSLSVSENASVVGAGQWEDEENLAPAWLGDWATP